MNFEEEAVARIKKLWWQQQQQLFVYFATTTAFKNHHLLLSLLKKNIPSILQIVWGKMWIHWTKISILEFMRVFCFDLWCVSPVWIIQQILWKWKSADYLLTLPPPYLIIKLQTCLHTTRIYLACFWCKFPSYYPGSWHPINMFVIGADECYSTLKMKK